MTADATTGTHHPLPGGVQVDVEGLAYRYRRGGDELYEGLSYTFRPGELTAVTGRSGRGKSTLLYLLGLMLRPSAGEIRLGDERVDNRRDAERSQLRATRIGFVFQDAVLDQTRTILDSVIEPALYAGRSPEEVRDRAWELLEMVGVADRAHHRPGEISGGQGQRAAIARAFMNDPDVILADEPTGNLDSDNTDVVLSALRDASTSGRTVVLATHDQTVMDRADRILEL